MASSILESDEQAGVLRLRLASPQNRNALSTAMKHALLAEVTRFVSQSDLRCLLLTGCGEIFCAGGDLRDMGTDRSTVGVRARIALTHEVVRLLTGCEKPVVTAVNGAAVGAGLSLALMGDVVLASETAYFMGGFPKVGVLPDMGILHRLPRIVGTVRAADLLMTSRRVDAAEALAIGLVSRVIPAADFERTALEVATGIAQGPGVALGLAKKLMAGAFSEGLDEFLLKESMGQAVVFGTADFEEGIAAFAGKRPPRFTGR